MPQKEIIENDAFDFMIYNLNNILNVPGCLYSIELNDSDNCEAYHDFKKKLISVSYILWYAVVYCENPEIRKQSYARCAGIIGHEIMHVKQYNEIISNEEYFIDFCIEGNLPDKSQWTDDDYIKYFNLTIEVEAYAFEMLVENTILKGNNITKLSNKIDKDNYDKIYTKMEGLYKKEIERVFAHIISL